MFFYFIQRVLIIKMPQLDTICVSLKVLDPAIHSTIQRPLMIKHFHLDRITDNEYGV